ncbi:MAG: hypothetical protein AMJ79_00105 [Phycisphaerae bacterium SM23_30]|nr:MAG: hypothetical protein AMJ79_00105 [Phycisphaerae bacterium SM23_30]
MFNTAKIFFIKPKIRSGFSLVELVISAFLVALIAGAVSLALYQSHQHSDRTRIDLIRLQRTNKILQTIAEDLRWAREILQFDEQTISFSTPDPDNIGATLEITYQWNEYQYALYQSVEGDYPVLVAENVNFFIFQADVVEEKLGPKTYSYLRGVTVTIQIGPHVNDGLQRYIECYNRPVYQPE